MAIIFVDGFDHYGSRNAMLQGVYGNISGSTGRSNIVTEQARTGTSSFRLSADIGGSFGTDAYFSRALPGSLRSNIGLGAAFFLPKLPPFNDGLMLFRLQDPGNSMISYLSVETTGRLKIETDGDPIITDEPVMVTSAWQHVEVFWDIEQGSVEVRVDEVPVINETDVTFKKSGKNIAQVRFESVHGSQTQGYIDDFYAWDRTGSVNNDFIGDKKVFYIKPETDVSPQDWAVTGASTGAAAIGTDAPSDNSYIQAAPVDLPVVSKFEFEQLQPEIAAITAVMTTVRQYKDDAGAANTQISLESNNHSSKGEDRPITTEPTYWQDVFEEDPNTGAAWTPEGLQDAKLVMTRTK